MSQETKVTVLCLVAIYNMLGNKVGDMYITPSSYEDAFPIVLNFVHNNLEHSTTVGVQANYVIISAWSPLSTPANQLGVTDKTCQFFKIHKKILALVIAPMPLLTF